MKKMLLKCLSVVGLVLLTSSAFAAPSYQVTVEPISDALSSHAALAIKNVNAKTLGGIATDIIVVNYSSSSIVLAYPGTPRLITERTSGRIQSPDYAGYATVVLQNSQGVEFWRSNAVGPFDTISVYLSNDKYVVYDTH
jgi:hypothetical protein